MPGLVGVAEVGVGAGAGKAGSMSLIRKMDRGCTDLKPLAVAPAESGNGFEPRQCVFEHPAVGGRVIEPEDDSSGVTNHDRGDRQRAGRQRYRR